MHVVLNAASAHMGGAVTYLKHILRWLPVVAPSDRFTVYVPAATRDQLAGEASGPVDVRRYPFDSTRGMKRVVFDQVVLPHLLRREQADLLFSTTGFGTWYSPCPEVLLVRNFAYFDPQFRAMYRALGRSLWRNRLRRWHALLSMRQADWVLFPTAAMRDTVQADNPWLPGERMEALHYGLAHDATKATCQVESEAIRRARRASQEAGPVLLNVSTYAVHKNLETLIAALPTLRERWPDLRLLTTTSRRQTTDTDEYDALQVRARALGIRDAWVELGYVDHEQLPSLYAMADVYVFPSCTESFGHSMVEAMAAGCPVVAAGTAVHREVCGDAGRYFDPFDVGDCARILTGVLQDDEAQAAMRQASRRRASDFSWKAYSERLVHRFHAVGKASTTTASVSAGASSL